MRFGDTVKLRVIKRLLKKNLTKRSYKADRVTGKRRALVHDYCRDRRMKSAIVSVRARGKAAFTIASA